MTPKEEAKRIVEMFESNHILMLLNSIGNHTTPYKSVYIGNETIEHQSKTFALLHIDGIMKFLGDGHPDSSKWSYWQKVKQEIKLR